MTKPTPRERILDAAFALFYKGGIHATGIDRVVETANVTRRTLYRYFPSKQDLILAVLKRRDEQWMDWFRSRVDTLATEPKERLLVLYDVLQEWFHQDDFYGCAFINTSAEFTDRDHPAHRIAAEHLHEVREYIYALCVASGARDARSLATQLMLLSEGAIVLANVAGELENATAAKEAVRALLKVQGVDASH